MAVKLRSNQSGQILAEFNLVILVLVLPLVFGGITWFWNSFDRARCANRAFFSARARLIQTHQDANYSETCGRLYESVSLSALETLDHDKGALDLEDLTNEVSELWEDLSQSWPR